MCIVIDTNTIARVFDDENKEHEEFKPVRDWIIHKKGMIVYGGTKYFEELSKMRQYLRLFSLLNAAGKAVVRDAEAVDKIQAEVEATLQDKDFDDPHIVAILKESACKLVCSDDKRAFPFFKHEAFFKGKDKPRIYSSSRNKDLLCDANIAKCCQPSSDTTNEQKKILELID